MSSAIRTLRSGSGAASIDDPTSSCAGCRERRDVRRVARGGRRRRRATGTRVSPVLGFLDEVILLPFALRFAMRLVPNTVMAECRDRASQQSSNGLWLGRFASIFIICVWLIIIVWAALWVHELAS